MNLYKSIPTRLLKRYPRAGAIVVFFVATSYAYAFIRLFVRDRLFSHLFSNLFEFFGLDSGLSVTQLAVASVCGVALSIPLFLRYLQIDRREERGYSEMATDAKSDATDKIQREINELRSLIIERANEAPDVDIPAALIEFRRDMAASISEEIRRDFDKQVAQNNAQERCRSIFKSDEMRLLDQLSTLRRRANLNLTIGVVTTLSAILVLLLTVYFVRTTTSQPAELITYFVPRVSTVVFVEVFSFFFLKLYKSTLDEEKYYQNEMTIRSARCVALETALQFAEPKSVGKLVEIFSAANKSEPVRPNTDSRLENVKLTSDLIESIAKAVNSAMKVGSAGSS